MLAPAGIVTLEGRAVAEPLEEESATTAPPGGALPFNVSTKAVLEPPRTEPAERSRSESAPGVTVTLALFADGPLEAEMVTDVAVETPKVVTATVAELELAGTVTFKGTAAAAPLELERAMTIPLAGAAPLSVTVAIVDPPPMTDLAPVIVRLASATGELTVRDEVRMSPLYVADRRIGAAEPPGVVVATNEAEVDPAGTVTLETTEARPGLELVSAISAPPAGAGADR